MQSGPAPFTPPVRRARNALDPERFRVLHPAPLRVRTPGMTTPSAATRPPAVASRIRRRLLERVADDDTSHLTIGADEGSWQPFSDGVSIKVLNEKDGILSYLLRLAPGATLPAHRHPADEECLVLEGRLRVGTRIEVGPGAYHLAHAGALHARITAPSGATIFLRGAIPEVHHVLA
jgi:quercetin dioxygenase-like cupin family protein